MTRNSWFFRHDLVDGFRVCQQILPISFSKSEMVTKRLAKVRGRGAYCYDFQ